MLSGVSWSARLEAGLQTIARLPPLIRWPQAENIQSAAATRSRRKAASGSRLMYMRTKPLHAM